ncbi:MAG: hypothetical protein R3E56_09510 [Burkholderiaceae bacterium]
MIAAGLIMWWVVGRQDPSSTMSANLGSVRLHDEGGTARVVLANHAKFNAMSRKMWRVEECLFMELNGRDGLDASGVGWRMGIFAFGR